MSRALLTVILSTCMAWASAAESGSTRTLLPVVDVATVPRMPLQPEVVLVKVSVARSAPEVANVSQLSATNASSTNESGGKSVGTLVATLVLMGVIALRRHKAGMK